MNQLRRISGNCFRNMGLQQVLKQSESSNNRKTITEPSQAENQIDTGVNVLRAHQMQQSELIQQKNKDNKVSQYMSDKSDTEFKQDYSQQHYSKKRAIKDVVESLYFQDHTEVVQYEFLKKLSSQKNQEDLDEIENDVNADLESQLQANPNINENDLKLNFDSLQTFLEEDLELNEGQFKKLVSISSSAKTAINEGSIQLKKIPESSHDILPIIENIHLNCHLLAFFVKYQKYFFSLQYYYLLTKLKQNADDIEYIKEFEMNKYEEKRKALQAINPQAKLKYKPVFLNTEETKAHFGYAILVRNLKQKFQHYDARKSIQILKALAAFDKNLGDEFYDLIGKRFLELKNEFSTFELVAYHFLLAGQCEKHKSIINHDMQQRIVDELMKRDESDFIHQVLNQIIKLRVMYPLFSIHQTNYILAKMQMQFTRQISSFTTKQLLEIAMVFLTNNIHFHKYFIEILFISILKNLPQEKTVKSKAVIQILKYFKNKNLYYIQRIEDDQANQQDKQEQWQNSIGEDEEEMGDELDENLSKSSSDIYDFSVDIANKQKDDSLIRVFRNSMKTALKIDGLFDALLSSVVREISQGVVLKPFSLHLLINIIIQNNVQKQAYYDLFISEYAKILPKASFLMFARMYQILSDQRLISKPLHILSAAKVKKNIKMEYVSYQKTQQLLIQSFNTQKTIQNKPKSQVNAYEQRQMSERQIKLTRLLLLKLNFCISNLWSYVLNQIRFDLIDQTDPDILSSSVIYCNSLIADIDKYLDSQMNTTMTLLQTTQQINNFIELQMKKTVPFINISKLVSNLHINVIDGNNNLRYSNKIDLLYQLHKRFFFIKYQPYIERNALVNEMIYDVQLKNKESSISTLINFVNLNHYNYQGQERGISYLKKHFANLKNEQFVMIDYKEFEQYIQEYIDSNENDGKNIPNYLEFKLQEVSLPKDLKLPKEIQSTLELFEQQIQQIYKDCKQEIEQPKEAKTQKLQNKLQRYSRKYKPAQKVEEDQEALVDDISDQGQESSKNNKYKENNNNNENKQEKANSSSSSNNNNTNNKYYQID